MDEQEQVLELGNVPEVYADGIGRVICCGPVVKMVFWTYQEVSGVIQRIAVMTLIRPTDSVLGPDEIRQKIELAKARRFHSGVWHVIWLALFDWDSLAPLVPMVLGPLH